jgi:hypothetical protein
MTRADRATARRCAGRLRGGLIAAGLVAAGGFAMPFAHGRAAIALASEAGPGAAAPDARAGAGAGANRDGWRALASGLELGAFTAGAPGTPGAPGDATPSGAGRVTILRIDPNLWDLEFAGLSETGEAAGRTAREWCERQGFTAVINAGMFATDYRTHIGYLRHDDHVNSSHVTSYQSVAAFDPVDAARSPRYRIFDLDDPGVSMKAILRDYTTVVQNLRLIKRPGSNRWTSQAQCWSEAALAEDDQGRILFVFSRAPLAMHELNRRLLALDIGLVAAQHLEGGPEAQLYLRCGGEELELFGSYETALLENDDNAAPCPIPNVLGIRPRATGD